MGKLKKDISSVNYLHFVNNIWKTTRACCNCRVVNGECADIARKGKCNAFRNELNAADILVFKNESYEFVTTRDAISKALEANRNNADCPWETVYAVLEDYDSDPDCTSGILRELLSYTDILAKTNFD